MLRQGRGGRAREDSQKGVTDMGTKANHCGSGTLAPNIKVTESSVSVAYVRGLDHQHPTMITIWGHRDRSKRKKINK